MKLSILSSILLVICFGLIFFYAPEEKSQGIVQKIFYIHVSSALTMYVGYFIAFVASIFYLIKRNEKYFYVSLSAIEVSYLFTCAVLLTGPFWAKPIWGAYWTWEPRLTTTFILWLMYTAYLLFHQYMIETKRLASTFLSILSILAFINVPLIHFSVKLWRGVHPSVIKTEGGLPPSMTLVLLVTLFSFLILFLVLFQKRLFLEKIHQRLLMIKENQ